MYELDRFMGACQSDLNYVDQLSVNRALQIRERRGA